MDGTDGVDFSAGEWYEQLRRELNDPAAIARQAAEQAFLERVIFDGLQDLHPSFDSPEIRHFTAADFWAVVDRCTQHSVRLVGIEVFMTDGYMLDVRIGEEDEEGNSWCLDLLKEYELRPELSFCATYQIPPEAIGL